MLRRSRHVIIKMRILNLLESLGLRYIVARFQINLPSFYIILWSVDRSKLIPALYVTATSEQEHNHTPDAHRSADPKEYLPSVDRILVQRRK